MKKLVWNLSFEQQDRTFRFTHEKSSTPGFSMNVPFSQLKVMHPWEGEGAVYVEKNGFEGQGAQPYGSRLPNLT